MRVASLLLLSCLAAAPVFAQGPAIDWPVQQPELLRHYRALLQIDSSNPPGNETRALPNLATSGPRTNTEARILRTRSYSASY